MEPLVGAPRRSPLAHPLAAPVSTSSSHPSGAARLVAVVGLGGLGQQARQVEPACIMVTPGSPVGAGGWPCL